MSPLHLRSQEHPFVVEGRPVRIPLLDSRSSAKRDLKDSEHTSRNAPGGAAARRARKGLWHTRMTSWLAAFLHIFPNDHRPSEAGDGTSWRRGAAGRCGHRVLILHRTARQQSGQENEREHIHHHVRAALNVERDDRTDHLSSHQSHNYRTANHRPFRDRRRQLLLPLCSQVGGGQDGAKDRTSCPQSKGRATLFEWQLIFTNRITSITLEATGTVARWRTHVRL